MAALDLGFLLRGAGRALTGYRQGTREREEMERARQVEDAERMFKEWATKQQMERERARDAATVDYQNRTLAQQAARDAAAEASRKRDDEQLTEEAVARRQSEGYETAIPETAQTAANAALSGLGMGQFGVVRARKSDPRIAEAGGVKFRPEETGDVQYITTGGRMMRRDPQRAANAAAQEKADELAAELRLARERGLNMREPYPSEMERSAAADLPIIEEAVSRIRAMTDPKQGPQKGVSVLDAVLSKGGIFSNPLKTPEYRQYEQALDQFMSVYPFTRGGKALTDVEKEMILNSLKIRPGDDAVTKQYRMADLERRVAEIRARAGRALPPPNTEASLSDADLWEKKVQEGMSKDEATRYVRNRRRQ